MNRNTVRARWQQAKASILARCGFLSDEQLERIDSKRAELSERIQQAPGMTLEQAGQERQAVERCLQQAAPTLVGRGDDEIRRGEERMRKRER